MYLSLGSENPATTWLGTTWQKQEGRFLLGSSSSYSLGATGGASSIALSVANMPSHTHSASQSAHTHSQPTHYHSCNPPSSGGYYGGGKITEGSEAVESGTAFSILPPYLVVNIWKRLS